jgi:predicted RNase H-like nuclease
MGKPNTRKSAIERTTIIVGLDAAAQPKNFGCVVCRRDGRAWMLAQGDCLDSVENVAAIAHEFLATSTRALLAIDAPLGWPLSMGNELSHHHAGDRIATSANDMFRRNTDNAIRSRLDGIYPLDIGADRIARASWSALNVLGKFRDECSEEIPLARNHEFSDRIAAIEVYPAATLVAHGAARENYKKKDSDGVAARAAIAKYFTEYPWLADLVDNANVFDAGLCAIAGADFLLGNAVGPQDEELAAKEGWIWVRDTQSKL